ncbi:hypothetical protein EB796_023367 [Bugula neritina]|uniref:Uncharacterized protein n=1 Tax=Bugula neritina TaxID=10212 RepID=A0A7J7IWN1_BUGNE|nr:hypothetical protein EB796_023367 [Bugula neritina]
MYQRKVVIPDSVKERSITGRMRVIVILCLLGLSSAMFMKRTNAVYLTSLETNECLFACLFCFPEPQAEHTMLDCSNNVCMKWDDPAGTTVEQTRSCRLFHDREALYALIRDFYSSRDESP